MASNQTTGISVNLSTGEVNAGTVQFRNRIINGDMRIAQRGASVSFSSGNITTFCVDRFAAITNITTGAMTMDQVSLSASDAPFQKGIQNSLRLTATTGLSSYLWCGLSQYIEDKNIADLNWGTSYGAPISVSFWIRANVPNGSLLGFNVRSYLFDVAYNVNILYIQNNSWQFVSLLIPPPPVGTIWTSNGRGLQIYIAGNQNLQSQTAIEGWTTTGNLWGLTTTYKPFVVTGQWVEWTGVQLEKGPKATTFEFRPYPIELQLCQRYYQRDFRGSLAVNTDATRFTMSIKFVTSMRSQPSVTLISGTTFTVDFTQLLNISVTPTNFRFIGLNGCTLYGTHDTLGATGHPGEYSSDNIQASAEL
jgi:hypothetical protein